MNIKDKPPDKDYFTSVKLPLKYILKNPDINLPKINHAVIKCNKIVVNTLMFLKLYLLYHFEKYNKLPKVDRQLVFNIMKVLCVKKNNSGAKPKEETQTLKKKLSKFYNKYYKPFIIDIDLDYEFISNVLEYLAINIITTYETNIKLHYIEYVERYINIAFDKKESLNKLKDDESKAEFISELRKVKSDILSISNDFKSDESYHKWVLNTKMKITPYKKKYAKDSIHYDLACCPQDYLICMIRMMKKLETKDVMIYNVFPMRNDCIPHSIKLDTSTLVNLLITKKQGKKESYKRNGDMKKKEDDIWRFFFRTEIKCFRIKDYSFHHMIETDGISCSILFLRKDLIGKKLPNSKIINQQEQYIDEVGYDLKKKNIVGIDPGHSDLIYCVDDDSKNAKEFRYTQNSRRKECKIKKYSKIILKLKEEKVKIPKSKNELTITECETKLSKLNRKTLDFVKFIEYIKLKSKVNNLIFKFYERDLFRKLKLNEYINRKKHEQIMINKFKEIFGKPDKTIVCIGDYEQKKHIKFREPTKGKGIRTLFRKNGYKVFLVDEFRTSCMCSKCQNEEGRCEKFRKRENPKPYRSGEYLVHGVIRCKNCQAVWNRDVNGATNIYRIAKQAIFGKPRPDYLSRSKIEINIRKLTERVDLLSDTVKKLKFQLRNCV